MDNASDAHDLPPAVADIHNLRQRLVAMRRDEIAVALAAANPRDMIVALESVAAKQDAIDMLDRAILDEAAAAGLIGDAADAEPPAAPAAGEGPPAYVVRPAHRFSGAAKDAPQRTVRMFGR